MSDAAADLLHGYTTGDIARRHRVGEEKVRGWIKSGQLAAINTSDSSCARPRYVVTPDALHEFERKRSASPPPKPPRRRRRPVMTDFYPD